MFRLREVLAYYSRAHNRTLSHTQLKYTVTNKLVSYFRPLNYFRGFDYIPFLLKQIRRQRFYFF